MCPEGVVKVRILQNGKLKLKMSQIKKALEAF
jgi:hypothetical protein